MDQKGIRDVAAELTEEELAELDRHGKTKGSLQDRAVQPEAEVVRQDPEAELPVEALDPDDLPDWAQAAIPAKLRIPKGRVVAVFRFRREWTDDKVKDRTCVMWNLSVGDEKLANQRGGDTSGNVVMELSKQMVRAVDGNPVDFTGANRDGNIDAWWNAIGRKCRSLVISHYIKSHSLTTAEKMDFLANCQAVRSFCVAGA
jgi:hypothetical protein